MLILEIKGWADIYVGCLLQETTKRTCIIDIHRHRVKRTNIQAIGIDKCMTKKVNKNEK